MPYKVFWTKKDGKRRKGIDKDGIERYNTYKNGIERFYV